MKQLLLLFSVILCLSTLYAQKDTVYVPGFYESGGTAEDYGTLNVAIEAARANGTINNTVFKLTSYDVYVLSRSIFMSFGENLEIVAERPLRPGEGTPEQVQASAPPQIVWTEEDIDRTYLIQTYGDVVMKNIWVRFDDFSSTSASGSQRTTSIAFEDSVEIQGDDKEMGYFENVVFDYSRIGAEGSGTICVKADHFTGIFKDCFFRNISDFHYQYYGRAVSFPFDQTGFHYDSLLFENCTFTNLGRIVMQEAQSFGDNVHINHCTMINSVEWVYQTGRFTNEGWLRNCSITNSIFVNPWMFGYRALDVCEDDQDYDDFLDGLCDPPGNGGLISQIQPVDSFGFAVDWTDFDRKLYVSNIAYMYQDWLLAYYSECTWCRTQIQQRHPEELYNPPPMIAENDIAFIDSVDTQGNKVFTKMNVDWAKVYNTDPEFTENPTNVDTLKLFLEGRWGTGLDIDWAYVKDATFAQSWPLPEKLAYNNAAYQTAAMGGFPLGDLNWWPDQKAAWEAQRDNEWVVIKNWLNFGTGDPGGVSEIPGTVPVEYLLDQNYPNPFNPATIIKYSIPKSGHVSLKVFNPVGQEIATIFEGTQHAGSYIANFDGSGLSSGVYMYTLQSGDVSITKKFVLMK